MQSLLHHKNLLHHSKLATCVISKIINAPVVAVKVVHTPKQIDLTSIFVIVAALLHKHIIVNKCL